MKWAVDKIIGDIAIIENIQTLEKREVNIKLLPSSTCEGSILSYSNDSYSLEISEEEKRRRLIEERFKKLRNNI